MPQPAYIDWDGHENRLRAHRDTSSQRLRDAITEINVRAEFNRRQEIAQAREAERQARRRLILAAREAGMPVQEIQRATGLTKWEQWKKAIGS